MRKDGTMEDEKTEKTHSVYMVEWWSMHNRMWQHRDTEFQTLEDALAEARWMMDAKNWNETRVRITRRRVASAWMQVVLLEKPTDETP